LIPAVLTPFHSDGSLALQKVEQQAALLHADGVSAVFVGGTTGEFSSLTIPERLALAERWLQVGREMDWTVLIHVGANCLEDSCTLAAQAQKFGAGGIAMLSPHYFKPASIEVLIACCAKVAASAPDTPFYFYDIPALTGVHVPITDWVEQAYERIPNFAGIKYTHTDLLAFQMLLQCCNGQLQVFYGMDEHLLAAWVLGGKTAVGSGYNFAAPLFHRLLQAAEGGDLTTARQEQWRAARLINKMMSLGYLASAKELLRIRGVDLGPVRLPLQDLTIEQVANLRRYVSEEGVEQYWNGSH
jgi:N-acetylneuraminate lyase